MRHNMKTYTEDEIREMWAENEWTGKAAGDPFIVRGGYNCRHHFRPVFGLELDDKSPDPKPEKVTQFENYSEVNFAPASDKEGFLTAMNGLSKDQINAANKLPPIKTFGQERDDGWYLQGTRKLVGNPSTRGGSVIRHEYGHHIDAMIGEEKELPTFNFSSGDKAFIEAYSEDRKLHGIHRSATFNQGVEAIRKKIYERKVVEKEIRGVIRKFDRAVLKDDELGNFSDILDALTFGRMQKEYGGFGHGVSYFKRKSARYQESFANLWALRNTKHWGLVQETFPNMAKRFDEILKEYS
jgi:hypothetical protein